VLKTLFHSNMAPLNLLDISFAASLFNRLPSSLSVGSVLCGLHSELLSQYFSEEEVMFLKSLFRGSYAVDYSPEARKALDRIRML